MNIRAVLSRPRIRDKYSISTADIKELLELVDERSDHVFLEGDVAVCRDADDIKHDKKVSDLLSQHKISVTTIAKFLSILKDT